MLNSCFKEEQGVTLHVLCCFIAVAVDASVEGDGKIPQSVTHKPTE